MQVKPGRGNKKITIKDVARVSGVSTQTVSRVINQRPDVAPETRQRVLAVIDELSYQPSALARSLRQGSKTLGVIIAGLKYAGISQTLNGITEQAEADGYSLLLKELPRFDLTDVQPVIRSLLAHEVEGIIYAAPECGDNWRIVQSQLPEPGPPVVFLKGQSSPRYPTISVDNQLGAQLAVDYLLAQGRRHIGHICGPLDWWEARQRKTGWEACLQVAGLPRSERAWATGNWSSASGEKAFLTLLENYPEVDAVFAANDQMALAVLNVAYQRGIHVPQDLAVVGFDDLAESAYFIPALTTVKQDVRELGLLAVRKILQLVDQVAQRNELLPDTIILQPQLIRRESA